MNLRQATDADACDPRLIASLAERFRDALRDGSASAIQVPPRITVAAAVTASGEPAADVVKCLSMPAVSLIHDLYVNKVATISAGGSRGATVTAVVPMFSARDGRYFGALDGGFVTALKCAAVTALVTQRCTPPDVGTFAIIGSGTQALSQFAGVAAVRAPSEIRIHSRTKEHAERFADVVRDRSARAGRFPDVRVFDTVHEATAGADVISTTTTSTSPLPLAPLVAPVHINVMGGHTTHSREVSRELLETSVLFVEDRATAITEAGAVHENAHELDDLDRLNQSGLHDLRERRTIFSSTGCAWLDLLTCAHLRADIPLRARAASHDPEV